MSSIGTSRLGRLFRSPKSESRYNVAKSGFVARVRLLDDTTMDCTLGPEEPGSSLLAKVGEALGLMEVGLAAASDRLAIETPILFVTRDRFSLRLCFMPKGEVLATG